MHIDSLSFGTTDMDIEKSRILVLHIKSGKLGTVLSLISKIKEAVTKLGDKSRNASIYLKMLEEAIGSHPQITIINRFPNGWMEMEEGYLMPLRDLLVKAYSAQYVMEWAKEFNESIDSSETFLSIRRADLSTK